MHKVIAIDLNGRVYQLDERGYDSLCRYLEHAESRLGTNPDKAEIIRDLEQSIGEKLTRYLGGDRTVVTTAEVEQVLGEVGPVEGVDAPPAGHTPVPAGAAPTAPPRRLYLIRDGAMISGLCAGIAAYCNLDPTLVRVAFVASAVIEIAYLDRPPVLTAGLYVLLMFLVPAKTTSEGPTQTAHEPVPVKVHRGVERVKALFGRVHHTPQ